MDVVAAFARVLCLFVSVATCPSTHSAELLLSAPTLAGTLSARSWKDLRDDRIVKQDFDYSCGAASLATILQSFYGVKITEEELLRAMGKEDAASFADMAGVLPRFGFKAVGVALEFEQLRQLKIPAMVHLSHRDQDHFSVLRGATGRMVWLGDPSWGNRKLSYEDFLSMWEKREDGALKGRALLVLPLAPSGTKPDFFGSPADTSLPIELLSLRVF